MRALRIVGLIWVVILAACGTPQPTATPAPTATPEPSPMPTDPLAELPMTVEVPIAGTLRPGGGVPQPNTTPIPFSFDELVYAQSGGLTGRTVVIRLFSDGRVLRDDAESTVSREVVDTIKGLLERIDFYNMQGIFTGPGVGADRFRYSLEVIGPLGSRTISAQDGLTPPELMDVFEAISQLGVEAQPGS